ncbi:MBL fold metallo-hydrolase [Streptomyces hainanensis]|uniref:MBL fold metallo-hydrolase n=1 Tax=Streptomyces hainanensis TaxID=402648 RepID=A0A4R4TXG9_9ACTN|nr:MBL fold metallo-hydrolase [Streptomyces hainanensis]
MRKPATVRSLRLGETTVTYVPDGVCRLTPTGWFPASTDEDWAVHPEYLDEAGNVVAGIGGLLVERDGRALLIDAGFGPHSYPTGPEGPVTEIQGGALLDNLARLGRAPTDVEAVAFTHLHVDHVGWGWLPTPGGDRPPFAHAPYLVSEPEWTQREFLEAAGTGADILDAMAPYVRTVTDGEEIFPGVRVRLSAGHSPGHASYVVTTDDRRLIAFGDAMHTPAQIHHPDWHAAPDHDTTASTEARRGLVAELQEPDTIGFGVHFADVPFGRVRQDGDRLAWVPVDA